MCNEDIKKQLFELLKQLKIIENQLEKLNINAADEISKLLNEKKRIPCHLFWWSKYKEINKQIDNLAQNLTSQNENIEQINSIKDKLESTCNSISNKLNEINK